jgi:hypothetical protein
MSRGRAVGAKSAPLRSYLAAALRRRRPPTTAPSKEHFGLQLICHGLRLLERSFVARLPKAMPYLRQKARCLSVAGDVGSWIVTVLMVFLLSSLCSVPLMSPPVFSLAVCQALIGCEDRFLQDSERVRTHLEDGACKA